MGLPQTPEDQCLDLGVRLHKAHTSPQRLRTAQCCESCAPARSHPSTGGPDVVVFQPPDPMVPAPQTTAPPPLQKLQRSPAIPRQQTSQGGCPDLRPLLLPPGGRPVASPKLGLWGRDPGRQRPARSPLPGSRAVPSPATGQYLVGFQLCSVAYERHVPPPPAAAQKPRRECKVNPVSSLRAQPSASEGGPRRSPPSRRVPGGARALPSEHFPRPWRPQTGGAPISPRHKLRPHRPRPALQRVPTGAASQPFSPAGIRLGPPRGRGHPGAELPRRRSHFANQDFACLPTL